MIFCETSDFRGLRTQCPNARVRVERAPSRAGNPSCPTRLNEVGASDKSCVHTQKKTPLTNVTKSYGVLLLFLKGGGKSMSQLLIEMDEPVKVPNNTLTSLFSQ